MFWRRIKKSVIGKNSIIDKECRITNSRIGRYCRINKKCKLTNCDIGDFTYLSSGIRISNVTIGKFSSLAQFKIVSGRHPLNNFVSTHPVFYSNLRHCGAVFSDQLYFDDNSKGVAIENDVWIGHDASIIDGLTIGNGAVIGANCLVTKNVPPYAIVAGVPARVIRYRFSEKQIKFLLSIQWWNYDYMWIKNHYKLFHDIHDFTEFVESSGA